jgi:hypothetical protein
MGSNIDERKQGAVTVSINNSNVCVPEHRMKRHVVTAKRIGVIRNAAYCGYKLIFLFFIFLFLMI